MSDELKAFLEKQLNNPNRVAPPPPQTYTPPRSSHLPAILWFAFGVLFLITLVYLFGGFSSSPSPTTTASTDYETRVIDVGPTNVKVDVPPNTCIHGSKNFNKIEVVSRDGDARNLYGLVVRSKTTDTVPVTFLIYPNTHPKCTAFQKTSTCPVRTCIYPTTTWSERIPTGAGIAWLRSSSPNTVLELRPDGDNTRTKQWAYNTDVVFDKSAYVQVRLKSGANAVVYFDTPAKIEAFQNSAGTN